jgi:glycyl-tRNA synthetase beta chain
LFFTSQQKGASTADLIPQILLRALAQLPIPKRMRWGSSRDEFVRPVHWAVLLFGEQVIETTILGIQSGAATRGHRFHHNQDISVEEPADYEELLEEIGGVIPDFQKRKELIRQLVIAEGEKAGATAVVDEDLLDEVTGLVEYPVALTGKFEEHFLEVPPEALILAMKSHQKCFNLTDYEGRLLPRFVTVSNIVSKDPAQVIEGNERVIRPRLADARFFFETDKQSTLESRIEQLKKLVFQDRLGTVFDKTQRVAILAASIAQQVGANEEYCQRAAQLSKCDLLTSMVGEFADLQGLMGYYYALNDGEPEEVAHALNEQYQPRYSGGALPESTTGCILAIADKLDSMVGLFGIKQPPTGSKDPFALRRAALGILRIVIEKDIDLNIFQTIQASVATFQDGLLEKDTLGQVFDFLLDRFRAWYMDEGISNSVFQSVLVLKPQRPLDFDRRVQAVHHFSKLPEAGALAAANKRVSNLLDKQEYSTNSSQVDHALLTEDAEIGLVQAMERKELDVVPLFDRGEYKEGLQQLADLKQAVDDFFDTVLVMCDDPALQANRLAILQQLRGLFLRAADISHLHSS